jgi:hypothetical protein
MLCQEPIDRMISTLDFASSIQHVYDKDFSGSTKSLDVSGTIFLVVKSGSDVIECQHMVIQKDLKICKELNLQENGSTKWGISAKVFR